MADAIEVQADDDFRGKDWLDCYLTSTILDAKYNQVTTEDVIKQQLHLSAEQKKDLRKLLEKHKELFSGKLGLYPHKKFHIDVDPKAVPVHS